MEVLAPLGRRYKEMNCMRNAGYGERYKGRCLVEIKGKILVGLAGIVYYGK